MQLIRTRTPALKWAERQMLDNTLHMIETLITPVTVRAGDHL